LHATDLALAEAGGISTPLVRMPYSAANDSVDDAAWTAVTRLGYAERHVVWPSMTHAAAWANNGVAQDQQTLVTWRGVLRAAWNRQPSMATWWSCCAWS
jgi:hypothetical protein